MFRSAAAHAVVALSLLFGAAACGHGASAPPAAPDYPPLPPLSSTPVGILIDQAGALALSDAQLSTLQRLDHDLHAKNDVLDGDIEDLERPARAAHADDLGSGGNSAPMGRGGRGRRGGGHRGGGGSASGGSSAAIAPDPHAAEHRAQAENMREKERANQDAALAQAMQALDAEQQVKARAILDEHGIHPPATEP